MGEISDALRRTQQTKPVSKKTSTADPIPYVLERRKAIGHRTGAHDSLNKDFQDHLREPELRTRNQSDKRPPVQVNVSDPHGDNFQQYRRLAFRIRELADAKSVRSIVISSAQPGDGKTTTSCHLAIQLAKLDQSSRVVLVDLDLRRANVAATLGDIHVPVPLDALLRGERTLDEAILETNIPGLSLLLLEKPANDPDQLLSSTNFGKMINDLQRLFDYTIIDTPPVLAASDAQVALRHVDAGLLVVRAGMTSAKAAHQALEHLKTKKILGSILNSSRSNRGLVEYEYYQFPEANNPKLPAQGVPDPDGQ